MTPKRSRLFFFYLPVFACGERRWYNQNMKKMFICIFAASVLLLTGCASAQNSSTNAPLPKATQAYTNKQSRSDTKSLTSSKMQISSSAFQPNSKIPSLYTCDGKNISPPFTIKDVPENAQSLALIADDPDAPVGLWIHWTLWNIDPKTTEISENSVPAGTAQGTTSFGDAKYGGPCPPSGTHRYFFKLYALDTKLDLPKTTDKNALETAMKNHILARAEIIGLYAR